MLKEQIVHVKMTIVVLKLNSVVVEMDSQPDTTKKEQTVSVNTLLMDVVKMNTLENSMLKEQTVLVMKNLSDVVQTELQLKELYTINVVEFLNSGVVKKTELLQKLMKSEQTVDMDQSNLQDVDILVSDVVKMEVPLKLMLKEAIVVVNTLLMVVAHTLILPPSTKMDPTVTVEMLNSDVVETNKPTKLMLMEATVIVEILNLDVVKMVLHQN